MILSLTVNPINNSSLTSICLNVIFKSIPMLVYFDDFFPHFESFYHTIYKVANIYVLMLPCHELKKRHHVITCCK
jgi:hypothetical protein